LVRAIDIWHVVYTRTQEHVTANERNDKKSLRRLQLMLQTALRP
jgi:hypothetical protein